MNETVVKEVAKKSKGGLVKKVVIIGGTILGLAIGAMLLGSRKKDEIEIQAEEPEATETGTEVSEEVAETGSEK
jgi:hypothetical protein